MPARKTLTRRVWFHRSRAALWVAIGIVSFTYGWQNSVTLVWIASLYANIISDLGAAEAADDRDIHTRLDHIETLLNPPAEDRPVTAHRWTRRPPEVEAIHLTTDTAHEVAAWAGGVVTHDDEGALIVRLPSTTIPVHIGDYAVRDLLPGGLAPARAMKAWLFEHFFRQELPARPAESTNRSG